MSAVQNSAATLPYTLLTTARLQRLERQLMDGHHPSSLMLRAGEALWQCARKTWPQARHWWIFCGGGNNGGDGYVLARLAKAQGVQVVVFSLAEPRPESDAAAALAQWRKAGGEVETALPSERAMRPGLIVDALAGIGLQAPLRAELASWITFINRQSVPVLAVDLPSGLLADTGAAAGPVIRAEVTLSLLGLVPGLLTGIAADVTGCLLHDPLGVSAAQLAAVAGEWQRVDYDRACQLIQPRHRTAHKGAHGRVMVIGGDQGMSGAVRLAGEGALRCGAGLVRIVTHADHASLLNLGRPELMVATPEKMADEAALSWATMRVLGPGLGQSAWSEVLWQQHSRRPGPLLVDADGLNWLAQDPLHRDDWILTPHPGEAARLLGCSVRDVEANRPAAVSELQRRYGGVVLLKGAGTLIADGKTLRLCHAGNPGMASGGMGDLLSGIIASLTAQGLSHSDATWAGACLHGQAGDEAAADGERGMLASDLLPHLRRLVNRLET